MKGKRKNQKKLRSGGKHKKQHLVASVKKETLLPLVNDLIGPLCEAHGIELVYVEYQRETGGRILRIYIDTPSGVKLDDCVMISRQAGDLLDMYVEDIGPYNLEVTSPGPNRPLGKKADFERFKGNRVQIKTSSLVEGRKKNKGILSGVSKEKVNLLIGEKMIEIPFEDITKANLVASE